MKEEITLNELKEKVVEYAKHNLAEMKMTRRIDELLMASLSDLIYEELKYIRNNDGDNRESDELQEFLFKDYHTEYCERSPLISRINEILNTPYEELELKETTVKN